MVVTVVGFAGGIYIWKPLFEKFRQTKLLEAEDNNNIVELHNPTTLKSTIEATK